MVWPRALGTTPAGMARAITVHSRHAVCGTGGGVRARGDDVADVRAALAQGWPVAMLIGAAIPRHWVLFRDRRLGAAVLNRRRACCARWAPGTSVGRTSTPSAFPARSPSSCRPAGLTAQSAAAAQQRDRRGDRGFEHSAHRRPVLDGLCGQLPQTADQDDGSRR